MPGAHDRCRQRARAGRRWPPRVSNDVRGRRLVRLAAPAMERRRARGLVLVDALRRIARAWARTHGSIFWRERTRLSRGRPAARDREHPAPGSPRSAPIGRRPTSASPTTCSTPTRLRPTPGAADVGSARARQGGGLLNARLRYFDPARRRAGVPEDVAALVSDLADRRTVVTLVNLSRDGVTHGHRPGGRLRGTPVRVGRVERPHRAARRNGLQVELAPGAGAKLTLAMRRYVNRPTVAFPWERR